MAQTYLTRGRSDRELGAIDPRGLFVRKAQTVHGMSFEDAERAWEMGQRLASQTKGGGIRVGRGGNPSPDDIVMTMDGRAFEDGMMYAIPGGGAIAGMAKTAKSAKSVGLLARIFGSGGAKKASVLEGLTAKLGESASVQSKASGVLREANEALAKAKVPYQAHEAAMTAYETAAKTPFRNADMISQALGRGPLPEWSRDYQIYREAMTGPAAQKLAAEAERLYAPVAKATKSAEEAKKAFDAASAAFKADVEAVRAQRALEESAFGFHRTREASGFWTKAGRNVVHAANFVFGPGVKGANGVRYGVNPTVSNVARIPGALARGITGVAMDGKAGAVYDALLSPTAAMIVTDGFLAYAAGKGVYDNYLGGNERKAQQTIADNSAAHARAVDEGTDAFTVNSVTPAVSTTDLAVYRDAFRKLALQRDKMRDDGDPTADQFYETRSQKLLGNSTMRNALRSSLMESAWNERYPTRDIGDYRGNDNPAAKKIYDEFVREFDSVTDDAHFTGGL